MTVVKSPTPTRQMAPAEFTDPEARRCRHGHRRHPQPADPTVPRCAASREQNTDARQYGRCRSPQVHIPTIAAMTFLAVYGSWRYDKNLSRRTQPSCDEWRQHAANGERPARKASDGR
ncbi:hypothetical protein PCO31111_03576 [Pandoraea communis]|uniref:Uncharacterized protein n=1 Tax=Pandoraea communis TaxID=2508297 RepID=A0A5E4WYV9_9BURK|nr:hypothetical protein PCO31111_03576 [Pandoraea communis]